jgi:hypothetical protein
MKHATNLQKLREKKSSKVRAKLLQDQKLRDKQHLDAMVKSLRALTSLLGKLGIAKGKFSQDHDELFQIFPKRVVMPRPPWMTGMGYGLSLGECYQWVKLYQARKSDTK